MTIPSLNLPYINAKLLKRSLQPLSEDPLKREPSGFLTNHEKHPGNRAFPKLSQQRAAVSRLFGSPRGMPRPREAELQLAKHGQPEVAGCGFIPSSPSINKEISR